MEQFITTYWSQILTLVGIVWGYARLANKVAEHTSQITHLENKMEEMNPVLMEIRERLSGIEATLKYLTKEK